MTATSIAVEIRGVHKRFDAGARGELHVLRGASASIETGAFAAIRGASGAGKSTLLGIVGGLLRADAGTVAVAGREPRTANRATLVGFVFQRFHLLPYLTVAENIRAAAIAAPGTRDAQRDRELMERLGIAHHAGSLPGELSVGEQQRTALARAMYHRPTVVLADEPTGNLDEHNTDLVLDALSDFAAGGGTVVMATHDPRAAERAGPRWLLDDGTLSLHPGAS